MQFIKSMYFNGEARLSGTDVGHLEELMLPSREQKDGQGEISIKGRRQWMKKAGRGTRRQSSSECWNVDRNVHSLGEGAFLFNDNFKISTGPRYFERVGFSTY